MRAWVAAARLGMTHRFTWRLEAVVAVVSALAVVVVNASLWTAAAGDRPLGGLSAPELGTYVVVAWVLGVAVGGRVEEWIGERFHSGALAVDLLRPLDLQAWALARHLGRSAASLALTAVPVFALMAVWVPVALPSWSAWPPFLVSVALAAVVGGEIGFLVGLAALRLGRVEGLAHLKAAAVWLLSGAVIPVFALPETAQTVVAWLPFQAIAHLPVTIFLERATGPAVLAVLAIQAGWALVLGLAGWIAWGFARPRVVVWGG